MALPVIRSAAESARRWDPVQQFDDMQQRMNHFMNSVFPQLDTVAGAWTPLGDLSETDDAYHLELDLPGVRAKDISIEMDGQDLSITGEFKERERKGMLRHSTRRTGQFEYMARLPHSVDIDKITAELDDGILRVTAPKAVAARPKQIEVKGR